MAEPSRMAYYWADRLAQATRPPSTRCTTEQAWVMEEALNAAREEALDMRRGALTQQSAGVQCVRCSPFDAVRPPKLLTDP
jgi:hypothetical protein